MESLDRYWLCENLTQLRDEALVRSYAYGQRKKLGSYTFGAVVAEWEAENGNRATLTERGIREDQAVLTGKTALDLRSSFVVGERDDWHVIVEYLTFDMDLFSGKIAAYQVLHREGNSREYLKNELAKLRIRHRKLAEPTDKEIALLYSEMQRGASGVYPFTSHSASVIDFSLLDDSYADEYDDGDEEYDDTLEDDDYPESDS